VCWKIKTETIDCARNTKGDRLASVLVTGATGAVGPALVGQLLKERHTVRILSRRPFDPSILPHGVDIHTGDITDPVAVARAAAGCEIVFHLAAKLHVNDPGSEQEAEYHHINVDGTAAIIEAGAAARVERIIFFSTIAVYGAGSSTDGALSESAAPNPRSLYSRTKLAAEGLVLSASRSGGPRGVVLRLAAVYGPNLRGNYRSLIRAMRAGFVPQVGRGDNRRTLVFDEDVARAAILAAYHPNAVNSVFNVTDGSVHTVNDIVCAISAALRARPFVIRIPPAFARLVASVGDRTLRAAGKKSALRSMVEKSVEDLAVSGEHIREVLGFNPSIDLHTGWRRTLHTQSPRGEY
jgi:nucleoside-diphosphate-sugar epimerase